MMGDQMIGVYNPRTVINTISPMRQNVLFAPISSALDSVRQFAPFVDEIVREVADEFKAKCGMGSKEMNRKCFKTSFSFREKMDMVERVMRRQANELGLISNPYVYDPEWVDIVEKDPKLMLPYINPKDVPRTVQGQLPLEPIGLDFLPPSLPMPRRAIRPNY